ncbi:MAG: thiopurine S-methyltransferase [Gammaproteobacteria bacterium]|nr:thiopurine S-methyltransferase [Gammaproteobacteria bacterium]
MEPDFWHDRWENDLIGFHLDEVNPMLKAFWPGLGLEQGSRVLVPLCGKTLDLVWLAEQGHEVVGVELSPLAVAAFFEEQGLKADKIVTESYELWRCGRISLICGDFFALTPEDIGVIDAIYDRAALIAMPEKMRPDYARQLNSLVSGPMKGLLLTLFYEQSQMSGPPFAVSPDEVQNLLSGNWLTEKCQDLDILEQNPRFKERGLNLLEEHVYLLRSRN